MSTVTDQNYLKQEQYQNAANLNARIALHQRFGTAQVPWHRWVFDQFDLPLAARILELGCGTGQLWVQNGDRLPVTWQVTLSDFSQGMVAQAQQNLAVSNHLFAFEQFDAQAIPFTDHSFDAVIANHMLYHVPDRQKTYAEIKRVLKPGGRFYATAYNQGYMGQVAALEARVGIVGGVRTFMLAADFFLENGMAELAAWFPSVTLHRQEEALFVTEVQPLIDYILSIVGKPGLDSETLQRLRDTVEAEIKEHGGFRIDKISGLFIAENG
jgi:SAM-dependent methyltransferase